MQITHFKSDTIADATGTVTFWNGTTTGSAAATDLVRPSDWNSQHALAFTLTGNTTLTSTGSGSVIPFAASGNLAVGFSNGTLIFSAFGNATVSSLVPYFPASTSSQTAGAMGTSTASALVFPLPIVQDVSFNHVKILQSLSVVTSTISGQQTISSQFGLYSNNAGTLSQISSGSFSMALTVSSVSGTISFPSATGTSGYAYGTSSWSTTAQAQSLFGTAGNRAIDLQFGGNLSLAPNLYWMGVHQRQSTSSAAVGLSSGFVGNAMNGTTNVGPIGQSTANFSSNSAFHFGAHGFYTSTGSAGYSGTALPDSMLLSGFKNNVNVMPMVTFMST